MRYNAEYELERTQEEMSTIREGVRKAVGKAEDLIDELNELHREDDKRMWLELQKRAQELLMDIRLAENKRLKPLQAQYAKAWNIKWRW